MVTTLQLPHDSSGAGVSLPPDVLPASGSVSIPSGGTATLPLTGTNGLTTAWGLVESFGKLTGVAIYQSSIAGTLSTLVGVEAAQPIREATIAVDNNAAEGRYTGIAIANQSQENLHIRLAIVNENGTTMNLMAPSELNPLRAQKQVVRFLHEFNPALSTFCGRQELRRGRTGPSARAADSHPGRWPAMNGGDVSQFTVFGFSEPRRVDVRLSEKIFSSGQSNADQWRSLAPTALHLG